MAAADSIDDRVSVKQVEKAVDALHSHESKRQQRREETELLTGKEPNFWLNVTVKQVAPKNKIKPFKIPIVHPLIDPRTSSICLITKDPQREYKELLEKHNIKFISRVVGIAKLRGKFKSFQARRLLLKENGLFLADDRVIPLLPKLLGSKWFEAKKQPVPVSLTRKDLKGELERAVSSTYMHQNNGTCTSIKVGVLSQKPSQVVANIQAAIPTIVNHIHGGWDNIQSFFIKTNTSASLPIWSCDLGAGAGGRWSGLMEDAVKGKDSISSDEEGDEDREGETKPNKRKQGEKTKGKKRAPLEEDESESDEDFEDSEARLRKKTKPNKVPANTKSANENKSTSLLSSVKPKRLESQSPNASTSTATDQNLKQKPPKMRPSSDSTSAAKPPAGKIEGDQPQKARESQKGESAMFSRPSTKSGGLSQEELKRKRARLLTVDRKKDIIVSGKRVDKAKAKILGKKAFQT